MPPIRHLNNVTVVACHSSFEAVPRTFGPSSCAQQLSRFSDGAENLHVCNPSGGTVNEIFSH